MFWPFALALNCPRCGSVGLLLMGPLQSCSCAPILALAGPTPSEQRCRDCGLGTRCAPAAVSTTNAPQLCEEMHPQARTLVPN